MIIRIFHSRTVVMHEMVSLSIRVMLVMLDETFQIWRQEQKKVLLKLEQIGAFLADAGSVDGRVLNLTSHERKILRLLHLASVEEEKLESTDAPREELVKIYYSMLLK